jgi:hypothetical protein
VAQGVGPEFNPQHCKNKKKKGQYQIKQHNFTAQGTRKNKRPN